MLFYPNERMAIFVDGANIYGAAKALNFDVDYRRLHELFAGKGILVRTSYYTAVAIEDDEFSPLRPLLDYLEYNGWRMVAKETKSFSDGEGRTKHKGGIQIDLAVDMMETPSTVDHVVLVSGDGQYCPVVTAMQRRGKRVSVVSTIKTSPILCSDELRRLADNFVELDELKDRIKRVPTVPATSMSPSKIKAAL